MDGDSTVRKGVVLSANDRRLIVRIEREDGDCSGCRACSLKSLCKGRETGQMDLPVAIPKGEGEEGSAQRKKYTPGDIVTVEYTRANAALAAAVMFVPALAGLALGGWLWSGFSDAALLAGCVIGFAAGVGVSWLIGRKAEALRPRAVLTGEAREA